MPELLISNSSPQLSVAEQNKINAEQNAIILKWVPKVRKALKSSTKRLLTHGKIKPMVTRGNHTEGKLTKSIKSKTGKSNGVIEYISFSFERHGVFVQKGVSKGHPAGNPRKATDWFNSIMEKNIPELANRIAEINANAALNATRMKIE